MNRLTRHGSMHGSRRGTILVVTLWVLIALTSILLISSRNARTELAITANQLAEAEASAVERGAEQYVLQLVDQEKYNVLTLNDNTWQQIQVGDGYFWVIRTNYGDNSFSQFGLVDENAKVNLNNTSTARLALLPGITQDIADAITDWRDADETVTGNGAESSYYQSQGTGYSCKNANFETVEELLLVRGITRKYLYGQNADGQANLVSPWNLQTSLTSGNDPTVLRGLYDYVTCYSREANTDSTGATRININQQQGGNNQLRTLLSTAFGNARADEIMRRANPQPPFFDVFDFYRRVGMTYKEFQQIADRLSTTQGTSVVGRVNINTAPREVLLTLPNLTETDVSSIIAMRNSPGADKTSIAWLADDGMLGARAVGLGNLVTTKSSQFSANIVAVSSNGRAYKYVRIVVDARRTPIRILFRKDLTESGFPMDSEILASLRESRGLR